MSLILTMFPVDELIKQNYIVNIATLLFLAIFFQSGY